MENKRQRTLPMKQYPPWYEGGCINEVEFCREFIKNRELKCIEGKLYDIDGELSDGNISHEISVVLMEYVTTGISRKVKSLLEALKLYCHSEPLAVKADEIHLLNGILMTDGTFIPEKRFCINRLNVAYKPERSRYPPAYFFAFLADLLEPEDILTLQEYLGYCLIPSTRGQAMLFIIGNGGEGKSRIGVLLKEIFGNAMVMGNFQRIETDKFFRYNLKNKLIMLDDDMQLNALPSTGCLKNLVTAEIPVDVEAKGQQSEQALLYSRILCFGNGSPKALYDKSEGFARRLLILTTKPIAPDRTNDPYLAERLIVEKEKIFLWLFEGLQRLIANDYRFTISEKTKKNISEVMSDNCNIIEFLQDETFVWFGKDLQVSSNDLYGGYFLWCSRNALTALKRETFVSWLKNNEQRYGIKYDFHIAGRDGCRVRGFRGINTSYVPSVG